MLHYSSASSSASQNSWESIAQAQLSRLSQTRHSFLAWCYKYLPEHFYGDPAEFHKELELLFAEHDRVAVAAPRGHNKSTFVTLGYVLYRAAEHFEPFTLIVSDTKDQAVDHLGNIQKELLENEALIRDYPHLRLPAAKDYRKKKVQKKTSDIITLGGLIFKARGAGQSLRGVRVGNKRPTLIVADDLENDEQVLNPDQRDKLERWFTKSLSNLPGAIGAQLIVIGTILHRKSLLAKLVHKEHFPAYIKRTYRAIMENGQALWPGAWTLEKLKVKKLDIGSRAFSSEYMNEPVDEGSTLIKSAWINENRREVGLVKLENLERIIVAVDPSVAEDPTDECGIIAAGSINRSGYILEDNSLKASPATWARVVLDTYYRLKANFIVAEKNNGGDLVVQNLRSVLKPFEQLPPVVLVWASRGKQKRFEPVATLYERGEVHHVGTFEKLEDELTSWIPGMKSPNRFDAASWALTELLLESGQVITEKDEQTLTGW